MTTKLWTQPGGTSADWNTDANWAPFGVPTSTDDAVFDSGTVGTSYTVTGNGAPGTLTVTGDDVTFTGTIAPTTGGGAAGTATIDGDGRVTLVPGAALDPDGALIVGSTGDGTSGELDDAGSVTATDVVIGNQGGGTVAVNGGTLAASGHLIVDRDGTAAGSLDVEGGGQVTAADAAIGASTANGAAAATLQVQGSASSLSVAGLLDIGEVQTATVTVQDQAALSAGTIKIGAAGTLNLDDTASLSGAVVLAGGTIAEVPDPGGVAGAFTLSNAIDFDSGTDQFAVGDAILTGMLTGGAGFTIAGGTVELAAANSTMTGDITVIGTLQLDNETAGGSGNIDFGTGGSSTLTLLSNATPTNTIADFSGNDVIDLTSLAYSATATATVAGNVLTVSDGGTTLATLATTGIGDGAQFSLAQDASGGTEVIACYCPGTLIRTPGGETAIEHLRIGDLVLTGSGAAQPIRWIGRRSYAAPFLNRSTAVMPVRIRAGALAEGVPVRDLRVSPEHAMLIDGLLVPASALLNGSTVVRESGLDRVDYIHLELAQHDTVWAEGTPSETFADDDSRHLFQNAHEHAALYPDAPRTPALFCAPRVNEGYALEDIRGRMASRAAAWLAASWLDVAIHASGVHSVTVPAGVAFVRLTSTAATLGRDIRSLGAAVAALTLDGQPVRLDDPRLADGFHPAEPSWRWTDGTAVLALGPAAAPRTLVLDIVSVAAQRSAA